MKKTNYFPWFLFFNLFLCISVGLHGAEQDEHSLPAPGFYCSHCTTIFETSKKYLSHARNSQIPLIFQCSECKTVMTHSFSLTKHFNTHTGERPFSCSDCSKTFADFSTLRNHKRIHSGEKPFKCEVCSQDFRQIGQLKTHLKSKQHSLTLKKEEEPSAPSQLLTPSSKKPRIVRLGDRVFKVNPSSTVPSFPYLLALKQATSQDYHTEGLTSTSPGAAPKSSLPPSFIPPSE
jgi:uncharacterized Zn-finger protein